MIRRVIPQMSGNRGRGDTERVASAIAVVTGRHVADCDLVALPAARGTARIAFDPAIRGAAVARQDIPVVTLLCSLTDPVAAELAGLDDLAVCVARVRVRRLALLARLHDPVAAHDRDGGMVWHWSSQLTPFGGSHCSDGSTIPSPHCGPTSSIVHVAEQPSPGRVLLSSHCSGASTAPSPHCGPTSSIVHVAEQPSPGRVLLSSHCSGGSTVPSPHCGPPPGSRRWANNRPRAGYCCRRTPRAPPRSRCRTRRAGEHRRSFPAR